MRPGLQPFAFDVSDIDATIERETALRAEARRLQSLRSRSFAQGYRAAAESPGDAAAWLELFEEKSA